MKLVITESDEKFTIDAFADDGGRLAIFTKTSQFLGMLEYARQMVLADSLGKLRREYFTKTENNES